MLPPPQDSAMLVAASTAPDEEAHGAAQNIGGTLNQVYKRDIQKIVN